MRPFQAMHLLILRFYKVCVGFYYCLFFYQNGKKNVEISCSGPFVNHPKILRMIQLRSRPEAHHCPKTTVHSHTVWLRLFAVGTLSQKLLPTCSNQYMHNETCTRQFVTLEGKSVYNWLPLMEAVKQLRGNTVNEGHKETLFVSIISTHQIQSRSKAALLCWDIILTFSHGNCFTVWFPTIYAEDRLFTSCCNVWTQRIIDFWCGYDALLCATLPNATDPHIRNVTASYWWYMTVFRTEELYPVNT